MEVYNGLLFFFVVGTIIGGSFLAWTYTKPGNALPWNTFATVQLQNPLAHVVEEVTVVGNGAWYILFKSLANAFLSFSATRFNVFRT